jgi:hypothetical protein
MSRRPVLSESQRAEIMKRSIAGQTAYRIGKDMGIPESTVRKNLGPKDQVLAAASTIISAERDLSSLSIPAQMVAFDLLSGLRAISNNLTRAAVLGSENAARLHTIAKMQLDRATIDPEAFDVELARDVGGFTRMANEAASLGMQLVSANKDHMSQPPERTSSLNVAALSPETLRELMKARNGAS